MSDEAWRTHERRWRQEPSDQDALGRAIAGMRRSGLVVPPDLLDARVEPATVLETTLPLEVWAVLPGERDPTTVGWGPGTIAIPPHRYWGVGDVPAGLEGLGALGDELRARAIPGLRLTQFAPSRRMPETATTLDLTALTTLGEQPQLRWLELAHACATPGEVVQRLGSAGLEVLRGRALLAHAPTGVAGRRLEGLEALRALRELELNGGFAPDDLRTLSSLPALDALSLVGSELGFADLEGHGLTGLRAVRLRRVTPDDLEPARRFERLARLAFGCHALVDVAECVAAIPRLRELEVAVERWRDDGLDRWRGLPLTRLRLQGVNVQERGVAAIAGLSSLRSLDLGLVEADLSPLGRLTGLEVLELGVHPGWSFAAGLAGLGRLRRLSYAADADVALLPALNALTGLETLELGQREPLTGKLRLPGLRDLTLRLPAVDSLAVEADLRALSLAGSDRLRPAGLGFAAVWPELAARLERLTVVSSLDDDELARVAPLTALRELLLFVHERPGIPKRVARAVGALPSLRRLTVEGAEREQADTARRVRAGFPAVALLPPIELDYVF